MTSDATPERPADGGMILSYLLFNRVIFAVYGAALIYTGWTVLGWMEVGHGALLSYGMGASVPAVVPYLLMGLGLGCAVAAILPGGALRAQSVGGGLARAGLLLVLSLLIYHGLMVMLANGLTQHFKEFAEVVPLVFKSLAGMSITGNVLIGFASQMNGGGKVAASPKRSRRSRAGAETQPKTPPKKRERQQGWRPPEGTIGGARMSGEALRDLRHKRMPH